MARGWESKAIESQQQDSRESTAWKPLLTPEERDRAERRASLELARASTATELGAASREAHRDMLRLKLDAIDAEIAALGDDGDRA